MRNKSIRVVILLGVEAAHLNAYFLTLDEAHTFIESWTERQKKRPDTPDGTVAENLVLSGIDPNLGGRLSYAVVARCIVGMYIAHDEPTAQERIAEVLEKSTTEGEDWKS